MQYNNVGNDFSQNYFCRNCGIPINSRQKFCTHCGHPVKYQQEYYFAAPANAVNNRINGRKYHLNEESKKILSYVVEERTGILVLGAMFIMVGVLFLISSGILGFLALLPTLFLLLWMYESNKFNMRKELLKMQLEPLYDILCMDFENGARFLWDSLRIGNVFVFGQHSDNICKISDITRVYQYVHKTNFVEDTRELRVTVNGREKTLCHLKTKRVFEKQISDSDEMNRIVHYLLNKNPRIKVGYR